MPRTRKGGNDVDDINAKFSAHEAAAKSIKDCFRKNTLASGHLTEDNHKLVKDFKFCSGKHVTYVRGGLDVQPQCRASKAGLDIPSYAKRNPSGNCSKGTFKKTLALAGGKRRTKKRHYKHPKKGRKSRTHKGRKDFTTKKSSKVFNRRKHYQRKSAKGKKRRPYHKRR